MYYKTLFNMPPVEQRILPWITKKYSNDVFFDGESTTIRLIFEGKSGYFIVSIRWGDKEKGSPLYLFECRTHFPIKIPPQKNQIVSIGLKKINGIIQERKASFSFILDENGELFCHTSIACDDEKVVDKIFIEQIFEKNVQTTITNMDQVAPFFFSLIYSEKSLDDAFNDCFNEILSWNVL